MMMTSRSLAVLLTVATLMAAPDIAAAQPAAPPAAPGTGPASAADAAKRAEALVDKAKSLYLEGKYQEAEAALLVAWELNPTFDVAYNLGNTEYKLQKHREAAQYLSFALRNWPLLKTVAKLKPRAEQWLAESRAQVGALKVSVTVAGADVLVDGKIVGRAPLEGEVFVDPGEHQVEARHLDYEPASQTVGVAKGGTAEAKLAITPVKAKPQASAGATPDGGTSAPGAGAGAPVMGQPPAGPVEPQPLPEKRSWVPVIALGAASAVGLGVGIGMTVASNSANSEARAQRDQIFAAGGGCLASPSFTERCSELHDSSERAGLLGDIALGSYIASGVLATAALTYALWPAPRAERSTALVVLPELRGDGFGLVMAGAW
ncbi:PEGA domain-containing protein [Sorangium sp. So ce302]|uniref:PEGA domain-containing protein n=1 Tax=Sorangium sp. So ce302 TaxID=3133297 RepID=UPI003F6427A7